VQSLRRQRDRIVSDVVDAVWDHLPGYSTDRLDRADLERFVAPHVDLVIELVSQGRTPADDEVGPARELGRSRALQGVPVDSVGQSFRLAEHALLRTLVRVDAAVTREELAVAVDVLVRSFDALITASTGAYHVAQREVAVHYEQLERDLVADLATGRDGDGSAAESRARILGCNPDAPHVAVVLLGGGREAAARRQLLAGLGSGVSGRILHGTVGGYGLLLVPAPPDTSAGVAAMVARAMRGSPAARNCVCGIGGTSGRLGDVGRSCREALLAAEVAVARGEQSQVVAFDDVLLDVALLADHAVSERLYRTRLGRLADQPQLLATLRVYLGNDLSQARTAAALVVHPNTVAYRLTRICELTGRDVRRVGEAMELSVALRAHDLLGGFRTG
jgi:hypothetical protein